VGPEFAALIARYCGGESMNVKQRCVEVGISTTTFYKYVERFEAEGVEGFYPRSRRPHRCPGRIEAAVEELVVRARKELDDEGWDAGADQIRFWLEERLDLFPHGARIPARATINRLLVARGLVVAVPQRRPRRSVRRFEADQPNTRWQMDGFESKLADGRTVVVLELTDDCSRFELALRAAPSENAADVWDTVREAIGEHGLPVIMLTDNGSAFSGTRRGWTSALEENLRELGVRPISSSIGHPQTCGKNERAHQPVQKWLAKHPTAQTIEDLQGLLDDYRDRFNHRRRKVHLGGLTPAQRYALGPKDQPGPGPAPEPVTITTARVTASGCIGINGTQVGLGRKHKGGTVHLLRRGKTITAFCGNQLLATFTLEARGTHQRGIYLSTQPHDTLSTKS
jgi:transposase InsO family protein